MDDGDFVVTEEECKEALGAAKKSSSKEKRLGHFWDACKSPLKALLLLQMNSGCGKFGEWKSHSKEHDGKAINIDEIIAELEEEKLSDEELTRLFEEWSTLHPGMPEQLLGCCACGLRCYEEKVMTVPVTDCRAEKFKFTEDEENQLKNKLEVSMNLPTIIHTGPNMGTDVVPVNPWKVKSFWEAPDGHFFHFHPELVISEEGVNKVVLCEDCQKLPKNPNEPLEEKNLPERCIAAGVDFGLAKRIGLPEPNFHESCVIATIRLYTNVVKVSSNQVGRVNFANRNKWRYHNIMFAHDAPEVAIGMFTNGTELLSHERLKDLMTIYLLDPNGRLDRMARNMMGTERMVARWWVVASWLKVLKVINPSYSDLDLPCDEEIREKIDSANREIMQNAVVVDDPALLEREVAIGSDIAQVAQHEQFQVDDFDGVDDEAEFSIGHSCVRHSAPFDPNHDHDAMQQNAIRALADLVELEKTESPSTEEDAGQCVVTVVGEEDDDENVGSLFDAEKILELLVDDGAGKSRRARDPLGDYTGDENTIGRAFPSVFLFGTAYGKPAINYKQRQLNHLLHQFSRVPAKNFTLLAYLEDCRTRAENATGVCAHVRSNPNSVKVLSELVDDPSKQDEIDEALKRPKSKAAKRLLRKYVPHLRFSSRNVDYSLLQSMTFRNDCFAATKRFGPPCEFLTLSFDDLNNPRSFRASFASASNADFPAIFSNESWAGATPDEFVKKLREATKGREHRSLSDEVANKIDAGARTRASLDDAVAHVDETKKLIACVCEVLLGIPAEHFFARNVGKTERSTKCFLAHKGIFGHAIAHLFVVEDHAKGTLHVHLLFYGGVSPHVMELACGVPSLTKKVAEVLDIQHVQKLDSVVHLKELVKQYVRFKIPNPPSIPIILEQTDPVETIATWREQNKNR